VILCSATLLPDPMQADGDALARQVDATAAAGFAGLSLWALHHAAAVGAGHAPEALRAQVRAAGLSVPVVEAILPWEAPDEASALAAAEPVFSLAAEYGARYVVSVAMGADLPALDAVTARYRAVCDAAAAHELQLLIEFLPWSGIPDLATAWRVVESADRDNAGILLDTWHWQRQPGGPAVDVLRGIPGERIPVLQVCDCAAEPDGDPLTECTTKRLLPGEGAVDFAELFGVLREIGADPLIAPEVFDVERARAGARPMAAQIRDATQSVLGG